MKKIFFILLLISCTPREENSEITSNRMKSIEHNAINGSSYDLIEVDGHEYLTRYSGGFVHLESCKCKKH